MTEYVTFQAPGHLKTSIHLDQSPKTLITEALENFDHRYLRPLPSYQIPCLISPLGFFHSSRIKSSCFLLDPIGDLFTLCLPVPRTINSMPCCLYTSFMVSAVLWLTPCLIRTQQPTETVSSRLMSLFYSLGMKVHNLRSVCIREKLSIRMFLNWGLTVSAIIILP